MLVWNEYEFIECLGVVPELEFEIRVAVTPHISIELF